MHSMNYRTLFYAGRQLVPNFRSNVSNRLFGDRIFTRYGYDLRVAPCNHIGCFCLKYIVKRCRQTIKDSLYQQDIYANFPFLVVLESSLNFSHISIKFQPESQ